MISEEDVLEHKPLGFGILNQAFNDHSPQVTDNGGSPDFDIDTKDLWVDIKNADENSVSVARGIHAVEDTTENQCKATESTQEDNGGQERKDFVLEGAISPTSEDKKRADTLVNHTGKSNTRITNLDVSNEENAACLKEEIISTSPKTLLEFSLENRTGKMETPQENDHLKDSQDSQGHCSVMQDTGDNEVNDLNDVRVTVGNGKGDQQNREPETVDSVAQESGLDAGRADIVDEGIKTKSIAESSERTQAIISCDNSESCLESPDDQNINIQSSENSPELLLTVNHLISNCDPETTARKGANDDLQLWKKEEDVAQGSENRSCISEEKTNSKTGQSDGSELDTEMKAGSEQELPENMSQVDIPDSDQCRLIGKDNATITNKLVGEVTMCCIATNEKRTEVIIKEPGFDDILTNSNKGTKERNITQKNSTKRVSNSVFYEDNFEESEQDLEMRKMSNSRLETAKLSSHSSSEGLSCFCGGQLTKRLSPYRPTSENDTSNIK